MTIAIDGGAESNQSAAVTSISVSLSTSNTDDMVVVYFMSGSSITATVADTAGLTWTKRLSSTGGQAFVVYCWTAKAASALSSDSITVTLSAANNCALGAFGISGLNTSSPFDPNSSVPVLSAASSVTSKSNTISTTDADDIILNFIGLNSVSTTITPTSGFTEITAASPSPSSANLGFNIYYEIVSAVQSGISVGATWTTSAYGYAETDALTSTASAAYTSLLLAC